MKKIFICLFTYLLICLLPPLANAEVMNNDNYTLEKKTVDIQPFKRELPQKNQASSVKPLAQGENYTVTSTAPEEFVFSTSQELVEFGKLSATNPVIRLSFFTITSPRDYQVFVNENVPLQMKPSVIIPDTTCDNGSCSETTSALWTNSLTYGFGYHLESMEKDFYRQFPASSHDQGLQILLHGHQAQKKQYKINYKVNVSGTHQTGSYHNVITYIATPDY